MTKAMAQKWLPLIQAVAEGKELQICCPVHDIPGASEWRDCGPSFVGPATLCPDSYRIKPVPREFWLTKGGGQYIGTHDSEADAMRYLGGYRGKTEIIHVREVL